MIALMQPLTPWLFACVPVGLALYLFFRSKPWQDEDAISFWLGILLGLLFTAGITVGFAVAGYALAAFVGRHSHQIWHQCWHGNLVSMRSADGTQGKFSAGLFLMVGYVDSQQTYYYYTRNKDGSFQPNRWTPDTDTSVFEEDRNDGEVFQYDGKFANAWLDWIAITDDRLRMDFHVPRGTIERRFDLK